jgi:subfamily B ATP-binding cassette protein MsbA
MSVGAAEHPTQIPLAGPSFAQRLRRIAPFFAGSQWAFATAGIAAIIAAATEPLVPQLLKALLDQGFQANKLPLWAVPIAIIGLFGIRAIAGFIAQYCLAWAANQAIEAMRTAMFSRMLVAQPALFTRHSASSLTNTVVYEVSSGASQLANSLLTLVRDSLTAVALLVYLVWLNWQLTLIVAVLFPAVALLMRTVGRRLHRLTVSGQQAIDELAYVVEENVMAWRIVRLHGAAATESARFVDVGRRLRRLALKSVVAQSIMTPLTQLLAATALSAVVVIAMWQSSNAGTTVGSFVAFVATMLLLIAPIKHLSEVAGPVTRALAAVERGVHLIDESPVESGGTHDPGRATGHIELRGVTLQYRADQPPALSDLTLELRPGETVALVGPSGAGKSTLVNLLPRFLEPTAGTLSLDGVPLPKWDVHALRRQFALVSQDVVLFNDTMAANVALGSEIDEQRVRSALSAANLMEFAQSLPQGLRSPIGHNGSQLSGGQRQRLAIARAIYRNAPILILDEATSALDSESERLVQQALEQLTSGRTSLVIAHRLSTIERADRIVALEAGRVVEQGTHAELLAHGGLYARLHALQFRS